MKIGGVASLSHRRQLLRPQRNAPQSRADARRPQSAGNLSSGLRKPAFPVQASRCSSAATCSGGPCLHRPSVPAPRLGPDGPADPCAARQTDRTLRSGAHLPVPPDLAGRAHRPILAHHPGRLAPCSPRSPAGPLRAGHALQTRAHPPGRLVLAARVSPAGPCAPATPVLRPATRAHPPSRLVLAARVSPAGPCAPATPSAALRTALAPLVRLVPASPRSPGRSLCAGYGLASRAHWLIQPDLAAPLGPSGPRSPANQP